MSGNPTYQELGWPSPSQGFEPQEELSENREQTGRFRINQKWWAQRDYFAKRHANGTLK
jgi:hypothetical protein